MEEQQGAVWRAWRGWSGRVRSLLHCRAACRGNNTSLLLPLSLSRTNSLRCLKVQVLYLIFLTALTAVRGGAVLRKICNALHCSCVSRG
ncbi:hypothetical protein E2C01_058447 [Portunus trituberculatus]|uniref:Uncharacterized protein n=1 Tax=Portunus trituberculatus TaxID=210409 RepID=A0A5B7H652_PORTR|nr:hypothetical protein [Portunus trituberculatus]